LPGGRHLTANLSRLAVWAVVLAVAGVARPDPALSLMLVALAGVVTIVADGRFRWERAVERAGLPSREAWVPAAMLVVLLALDLVEPDRVVSVVAGDGPVIVFILSFALVAEGLRRSGLIHFLAYRIVERGEANTTRLTLLLFLLSSALTYVTSNDVVILTMTPIVVSVAHQARIRNASLLLLSQFVAANTVSMGLLIGSPTNLILGRALDLHFGEYFVLMLVPSALAVMATFVVVSLVNRLAERGAGTAGAPDAAGAAGAAGARRGWRRVLVGGWAFSPTYHPPRFSRYRTVTAEMRWWVAVFGLSVALLVVGTATDTGLLAAGVVIGVVGAVSLWRLAPDRPRSRRSRRPRRAGPGSEAWARRGTWWPLGRPSRSWRPRVPGLVRVLPLGIVPFGLTYFVIADAVADTPFVRGDVGEVVSEHGSGGTPATSWSAILASGALVNTMNDLPAAALSGRVLERAELGSSFDRALVTQGALSGLNIATYVTPVGALAGIIWFEMLRQERDRRRDARPGDIVPEAGEAGGREPADGAFEVVIPRRRDLVVYGTATFLAVTLVLGAGNYAAVSLADLAAGWVGDPASGIGLGTPPAQIPLTVGCLVVVGAVVVAFRRALAAAGPAAAPLAGATVPIPLPEGAVPATPAVPLPDEPRLADEPPVTGG
jgi:Na+/H+ antiporter NhaD/arsenite permease-like protein